MPPDLSDEQLFLILTGRWALPNPGLGHHVEGVTCGCQLFDSGIMVKEEFGDWVLCVNDYEITQAYTPFQKRFVFAEPKADWKLCYE